MLSYQIMRNEYYGLEGRIRELHNILAPLFPELSDVTLRIRMKKLAEQLQNTTIDLLGLTLTRDRSILITKTFSLLSSAHETMHAVQHFDRTVPYGERSCDIFMLARLPTNLYPKNRDFYVKVPQRVMSSPERIAKTAKKALELRQRGMRNYIVWFETELKTIAS